MNANRIINMVVRMVMRRLVRSGVDAGVNAYANRRDAKAGKGEGQAQQGKAPKTGKTQKRMRQGMRMARRMDRF